MSLNTFGIWFGFRGYASLQREGISRYTVNLIKYLIKNFKIRCEIWVYNVNKKEVELLFSDLLNDKFTSNFISIYTESYYINIKCKLHRYMYFKNSWNINLLLKEENLVSWKRPYEDYIVAISYNNINKNIFYIIVDHILMGLLMFKGIYDKTTSKYLNIKKKNNKTFNDTLVMAANQFSQADCFLIPVFLWVNALKLRKRKIIALHDLHLYDFYDLFMKEWDREHTGKWKWTFDSSINKIEEHLKYNNDILFISNCDYVRKNHTLKYIKNVKAELTDYVYLPVIIPDNIDNRIVSEATLKKKYNINSRYIFFPTQIRPYKNVITLLKSLKLLLDKEYEIKLVLTGKLNDSKIASKYASENNLWNNIIETGDVPEEDLYSLHKYAVATVVTSLFEGGFPWPALEAMYMNTPAIIAKIEPAVERIEALGYKIENSGLLFFEPMDYKSLAEHIEYVICNREKIVYEQRNIKNVLLNYTWDDVSKQYYNIIDKFILNN
ncbi:MAG: glycosyltransferase family 4 protein [Spirochaetes bacterium]|nr:glycosyltransferase family 4 protein [Spirochaetota bacterium]